MMKHEPFNFLDQQDTRAFEKAIAVDMEQPIKHLEHELNTIRTGRASTTLVEDIKVDAYNQLMPLRELATLSTPDAKLITVQPWDKSIINSIERALLASDLGITPINDGEIIRLQLPQMSAERRDELTGRGEDRPDHGHTGYERFQGQNRTPTENVERHSPDQQRPQDQDREAQTGYAMTEPVEKERLEHVGGEVVQEPHYHVRDDEQV